MKDKFLEGHTLLKQAQEENKWKHWEDQSISSRDQISNGSPKTENV